MVYWLIAMTNLCIIGLCGLCRILGKRIDLLNERIEELEKEVVRKDG